MEENNTGGESVKVQKKGVSVVVVILLFVGGVLLGVGGHYLYNNLLGDKCEDKEVEDKAPKEEEVLYDAKSLFIKKLISKYDTHLFSDADDLLFQNEKTDIASFDSDYLKKLAVNNLNRNTYINSENATFTKEELELSYKELFTSDVPITHESIKINACEVYNYYPQEGVYRYNRCMDVVTADNVRAFWFEYAPVSAKKTNDKLSVEVAVAYFNIEGKVSIYKDKEKTNKVTEVDDSSLFAFEDYQDKLNKFVFNFTYNKDNYSYTLDNIELVK